MKVTLNEKALALLAVIGLAVVGAGGAAAQVEEVATYVGADTCAGCHDEVAANLTHTQHGKSGFVALSPNGCETCHGPGSLHVEDTDNDALRPRITTRSSAEQNAICLGCHESGQRLFWREGRHASRGLACTSCHSVHDPKSMKAQLQSVTVMDQCFTCHKSIRAETWKTSHHPMREGKISCEDCHNPHGSPTERMLKAASVNDVCYTCHTEKRGPFLWEHPPVRENCMNCHVPHGSNHLKLQRTSVPFICQQCHSNTRHPGSMYDGFRLPTLENPDTGSNRLFNRACLDCHAAIHGSNHPSSPYLGH